MSEVQDLIKRLRTLRNHGPIEDTLKSELADALKEASFALETPPDVIRRLVFSPLQLIVAKMAVDLNIFDILSDSENAVSLESLAKTTGGQDILLRSLLRVLIGSGAVKEAGKDLYTTHANTRLLSTPGFKAALMHHYEIQLPVWVAMPDWLATLHYQRPIDHTRTAFQVAHNTNNLVFEWAMAHPDKFHDFNLWMAVQRDGMASWLDTFPVERFTQDSNDPRNALLVDIGGGIGHQCAALSAHLPDLGRPIILQDIRPAIAQAIKAPGVEAMVADFWVEQPVKNASFYYLRNVLHDYEDKKCVELLQIQRRAMSKESVFLIDEIIMPDTKVQFAPSAQDIALMASLAAIERNKDQWKSLFDAAGLVLRETFTYSRELGYSIMVVSAA